MAELSTLPVNFGILGCAGIARKLSRAINLIPEANIAALGSRSLEKATSFAAENNFPLTAKVFNSYDAVLDDPDIDAVYIPLPTSLHLKYAVLAAQKKKHVLLEKPVAMNVGQLDTIIEACEDNGLQFMDGTMWMHHPRTSRMREFLSDSKLFGELKSITSCFTFAATRNFLENDIRTKPDLDGLGSLGDVGWYCIRSILWATNFELPKYVIALPGPVLNKAGVILTCNASLHWEDGKVANFHCSFLENLTMDVTVIGTKGTLHMNDFVVPYDENKASFTTATGSGLNGLETKWMAKPSEHSVITDLPQECLLVREFSRLVSNIKSNGAEPEKKWPSISRKTQLTLDAVKESLSNGFKKVEIVD
ncbi:hypothetical protein DCAR_0310845 [Daucus carota subsp. sativus]|uniref:Uncharacterized protein n=1 Tax=Daucus carota subsp. sativus TaxID=79200 RepID=A0A166A7W7_DAUCS|nr:PREDICTED: uncharacterized oxidoreductase At4g09670-like [Daucus carota subsp. sativus]XP_017238586.1 PREDICTED: uncharacterized oxidoreductase At4g09670-like [Daucus carota subsp. sativus]WOG91596.1 hypothetical protein DCAR_0310845 [Daucus carota subsp. sativus]